MEFYTGMHVLMCKHLNSMYSGSCVGKDPRAAMPGHMVDRFFVFLRTLCTNLHISWTSLNSYHRCISAPFVYILASICCCFVLFFFSDCHCDWSKMEYQCSIALYFSVLRLNVFACLLAVRALYFKNYPLY